MRFSSPVARPSRAARGLRLDAGTNMAHWHVTRLAKIACGRCMKSRAWFNPRGVKPAMSNFSVSHRGEPLQQRHQPTRHFVSEPYRFYARSIRAYALCAWMDSKFSMSTL